MDCNVSAFLALLRAGLWEQDAKLSPYESVDYSVVYRLAKEQAVVGLVAAGLEHVVDVKVPDSVVSAFVADAQELEQLNFAMDYFIGVMVDKMMEAGIHALLVKGEGISQCYERPLWRSCGDVDFFLDAENYEKAKAFLVPLASSVEEEESNLKHLGLVINPWTVELHGSLKGEVLPRIDCVVDQVQADTFGNNNVRVWHNGPTEVLLPAPDNDVIFIFTHILKHFFKSGIGLKQICDLSRLLWTYKDSIDGNLLKKRLQSMGMVSEWKAFAAMQDSILGLSSNYVPLYSPAPKWLRKAGRILSIVLETGSFGQNIDYSVKSDASFFERKAQSFWRHTRDGFKHFSVFPLDSVKAWLQTVTLGLSVVMNRNQTN